MRTWNYECKEFEKVRKILWETAEMDEFSESTCKDVLKAIQDCIKDISENFFQDDEINVEWIQDIQDDIELNLDENTINYRLEEFYDYCDEMGVWLGYAK